MSPDHALGGQLLVGPENVGTLSVRALRDLPETGRRARPRREAKAMTEALVLGSTGCIGNNIVRAGLGAGWTVRAFHRGPVGPRTWMLDGLGDRVQHVIGDLHDFEALCAADARL